MIIKPVCYTAIDDAEVQKDRPVSEEVVRKIVQNLNLFGDLACVASIGHFQINMQGVPGPNPDIWQIAIGGEILQANSPLKTVAPTNRFTPDMRSLYIRGAPDHSSNGVGGDSTVDLSHTHVIGPALNGPQINDGSDSPNYIDFFHTHDLPVQFSASETLELAHQELAIYMKIN